MVAACIVQHWTRRRGALRARHLAPPSIYARSLPGSPHPALERPRATRCGPPPPRQASGERTQPIVDACDAVSIAQTGQVVFYRLSGEPSFTLV